MGMPVQREPAARSPEQHRHRQIERAAQGHTANAIAELRSIAVGFSLRPQLSRELLDSVQALVGEGIVQRILIPQFVIQ